MLKDNHRRTLFSIWIAATLLIALTVLHVFRLVEETRAREFAAGERDLANLTRVSQEHAIRTLRSADQVIRFVIDRYLELGSKLDLSTLTAHGVIDAEILNQVGIIDEKGVYAYANRPINSKIDLSDREHFKAHIVDPNVGLFVSKPVLGRATGRWSMQLTRRITRSNGEFAGVVVVSIDPGYFTRFYADLKLGTQGVVALYGLDGIARARIAGNKDDFGSNAASAPMFSFMKKGQAVGSYTNYSVVDKIERLYYYREIPGYKLAVVAGWNSEDLLHNFQGARRALWLQAFVVSLLILALATAITRYLANIRRAMAANSFARSQIQDRNEQLDTIFALSPDGFVSFDREHRVKYVNPAFIQMTALEDKRLEGMDEAEFSAWLSSHCEPGSSFKGVTALRLQAAGTTPGAEECLEISANGKRVLQLALRVSDTQTVSQILYVRDITHETEVDEMKSEFLSTAAHELRTPMASIMGFSELLLMRDSNEASRKEFLGIIHTQSKLMANILDELLDLARIEARRGKDFQYTRLSLQDLSEDIVKSLTLPPGRALPEITMPTDKLYVMADEGKLRQAILNVLTNAYKYSPAGGTVSVEISTQCHEGQAPIAYIHVTDHGLGMTPEQVSRVFERFYRADSSGKIPGTGLGMNIVKEIIELHHGQITIDSTYGEGTRVSLGLPMNPAQ